MGGFWLSCFSLIRFYVFIWPRERERDYLEMRNKINNWGLASKLVSNSFWCGSLRQYSNSKIFIDQISGVFNAADSTHKSIYFFQPPEKSDLLIVKYPLDSSRWIIKREEKRRFLPLSLTVFSHFEFHLKRPHLSSSLRVKTRVTQYRRRNPRHGESKREKPHWVKISNYSTFSPALSDFFKRTFG